MSDINRGRYYSHDMGPYPYDWRGFAQRADRASGQGMGSYEYVGNPEGFAGPFDFSQRSTTDLAIAAGAAYWGYKKAKITKTPILNAGIMAGLALVAPLLTGAFVAYNVYDQKK